MAKCSRWRQPHEKFSLEASVAEEAEVVVWTAEAVVEVAVVTEAAWAEAEAAAAAWVDGPATGSVQCQTAITRTSHGGMSAIAARQPGQKAWVMITMMMTVVDSVEVCVVVVVTVVDSAVATEEVTVVAVEVVTEVASEVEIEEVSVVAVEATEVASGDVEAWTVGAVVVDLTGDLAQTAETSPIELSHVTWCTCSGLGQAAPWQLASLAALPALAA